MMTLMKLPALLLLLALLAAAASGNYCNVCRDHTMCLYPRQGAGTQCSAYRADAVTSAHQTAILNAHNNLRNRVALGRETRGANGRAQPTAANMRRLVWDSELATIAQRWASQCTFSHDSCRNTLSGGWTGQNLYYEATTASSFPSPPDYAKVVQNWYNEVKDRDGSLNTRPYTSAPGAGGAVVGHYTQLAWAETARVGCGTAQYLDKQMSTGSRQWTARIVACNYSPGGNVISRTMYQAGSPASSCPAGTRRDATFTGLCA